MLRSFRIAAVLRPAPDLNVEKFAFQAELTVQKEFQGYESRGEWLPGHLRNFHSPKPWACPAISTCYGLLFIPFSLSHYEDSISVQGKTSISLNKPFPTALERTWRVSEG